MRQPSTAPSRSGRSPSTRTANRCAVELVFSGPHTGDFVGIAATGREVRVPYSAYYDLTNDGISTVRVYGVFQELISALTA